MKKNNIKIILAVLLIIVMLVLLVRIFFKKETEKTLEERVPVIEDVRTDAYQVKDGKIYYRQVGNMREIKDADTDTFEVIDENYAKDGVRVYFRNIIIKDAEAATFEPINEYYSKDAINVFCSEISVYKKKIEGADPYSFEEVGNGFFKDKNNVYEHCHVSEIPDLDPETFEIVDDKTVKDRNGVYNIE